jgi:hypothetical protein
MINNGSLIETLIDLNTAYLTPDTGLRLFHTDALIHVILE